jgi:hypothetical protein
LRIDGASYEFNFNCNDVTDKSRIILTAIVDSEVTAIQNHLRGITDGELTVRRVLVGSVYGERKRDLFCDTVHREWTVSDELFPFPLDALALERNLRILFNVEEICIS